MHHHKLDPFLQIESKDPYIEIRNNTIIFKPYYFNYPFLMQVFMLTALVYAMFWNMEIWYRIAFVVLAVILIIQTRQMLRTFNTITIDVQKETITVCPSIFYRRFRPTREWGFKEVSRIYSVSNYNTDGYWLENRRYFVVLVFPNEEEVKLFSSNKEEVAADITKKMTDLFQSL